MRSLLILIFCLGMTTVHAQKMSWRKHAKLAKKQLEAGEIADAATNFEAAWQKKKKKKGYIFQAAECYAQVKDYQKAAEAYGHIKEENKKFTLPGLKYCRSLKMDGQYDEASRAFVYFINGYNGDDKDVVASIVQDEIRGCELGMAMLEKEKNNNITFEHLGDNVNSKGADFAPVPFADDVLYYTSNMVGETKMYLTQRNGGVWSRSRVPKNFPKIAAAHFGNGAFSPDNKRFFYTQCEEIDAVGRMMMGCQIYVTQRNADGWSAPQKLKSMINRTGSTTTHPFIVHENNREILYFSSDRTGGKGGLDIWYSSRDLDSEKMDFGKPQNLGDAINSMADEITPYFDVEENTLYFSSNGRVNIGGFDILKSSKEGANQWSKTSNLGLPYNSNVDDYYYRKHSSAGGYIVSNRKFGLEKTTYGDDDIYSFSMPVTKMMASGKIMDKATNQIITNVKATIYEIQQGGVVKLLENKSFSTGNYEFRLLPNKNYRIEVSKDGYLVEGADISTIAGSETSFTNNIVMGKSMNVDKISVASTTEISSGAADGTYSNPQPNTTVESQTFASDSGEVELTNTTPVSSVITTTSNSNAVGEAGVVYKIQLLAVRRFDEMESRYSLAKNYGFLETEYLGGKNLTRVLLSSFSTREEAKEVLKRMKQNKNFRTAVVVRYEQGVRIDPWKK